MIKKEINQNTEQKIIEVARELFATKGFDATSTRDICKAAGVNISMISYYFGGKQELYQKIVDGITSGIISHMMQKLWHGDLPKSIEKFSKAQLLDKFFSAIEYMVEYFYSGEVPDSTIMLMMRVQMSSGIPINALGYSMFKRLLSSILDKDENDKEVIFRCLTIIGQIHSPRILKQFSLKMMGQEKYTKEDIEMLKKIVLEQTKSILRGAGVDVA